MVVKKYKKNKNDIGALGGTGASNMSIKEPFIYNETVVFSSGWGDSDLPAGSAASYTL